MIWKGSMDMDISCIYLMISVNIVVWLNVRFLISQPLLLVQYYTPFLEVMEEN